MSYAPMITEPTLAARQYNDESSAVQPENNFKKSSQQRSRKHPKLRSAGNAKDGYPIIVHSHLRWDWVWQRPQQFVSRLSRRHRVLFVETLAPDPQLASPVARFRTLDDFPNLTILTLQFPAWRWQDAA